jgi:hypothetical protein
MVFLGGEEDILGLVGLRFSKGKRFKDNNTLLNSDNNCIEFDDTDEEGAKALSL